MNAFWTTVLLLAAVVAGLALAYMIHLTWGVPDSVTGGAVTAHRARHVAVDTLNLTHWLRGGGRLGFCEIIAAIDATAPTLKTAYESVAYVVKDRESVATSARDRAVYQETARRNGIEIHVVERLPADRLRPEPKRRGTHQKLGRDDFYAALLSWNRRGVILTEDRLRDFDDLRRRVPDFHVKVYGPAARPTSTQVKPSASAYSRMGFRRLGFSPLLDGIELGPE